MRQKHMFRISLILIGLYYCYSGLRGYIYALFEGEPAILTHVSLTNSFLDICLTVLGIGLIHSITKRRTYQMLFIKIAAVMSGIAVLAGIFVFVLVFFREHRLLDVLKYGLDLLWCVFALTITIAVWLKPSLVGDGDPTPL